MKLAHRPDILDCIAHLSTDEVPTPPVLANAILDLLPAEVWSEPDYRWLDPFLKSGVFLREVAKRLLTGLAAWEPDESRRIEHIYRNMLFGTSITQLTGEMARRTVYYSRHADSKHSVVAFPTPEGNLPFIQTQHTFDNSGTCVICRAPQDLERGIDRENYAYSFIHGTYPTQEMKDMQFDVIVGNPPYQIDSDGNTRTKPVYHYFVRKAIEMNPEHLVMITPSRWFSGGLGLDEFRDEMINDRRIATIVDNPKLFDCFPGVEIKGGVSYFLWQRDHDDDCEFSTRIDGKIVSTKKRDLREGHGVLIRDNRAAELVHLVLEQSEASVEDWIWPRLAFSQAWRTNYRGESDTPFDGAIPLVHNRGIGYVSPSGFQRNIELVPKWKVLLPKAGDGHGREVSYVIGEPIALAPGSVCTETYFVVGTFDTREECENYAHYLATKFVRFLVLQRKTTQDITPDRFRFVPALDMKRRWTDEQLFDHFKLTATQRKYVETVIQPRSPQLFLDSPIPTSHLPGGSKYRDPAAEEESDEEGEVE